LVLQALSFAGFTVSHEIGVLYSAAAVFGISYGGTTALFPALVGDFFGRLAIGAIVGVIFSIAASASAFGPLIAGYFYTAMHTYRVAFELGAALNLVAAMLLFLLKRPLPLVVEPP
jgi:MFS family permease